MDKRMNLFGTAGIRGITNRDITPEMALRVSLAYGTVFRGTLAVARDTRYGAEMIEHAVISGFQATGNRVISLGIVPLPLFSKFVADSCDGGIIVTGSHTPPNITGLIAVDGLGRDLSRKQSDEVERVFHEGSFKTASWDRIEDTIWEDAMENYMKFIEKRASGIGGYRVLIDPANGAGAGIIERILESLGVKVHCIHCDRRKIPQRPSEPRRESLKKLRELSRNFDIGAGTDVDADRVLFASQGQIISEDVVGAIFAERYGSRGVVTPINSSMLIEEVARRRGFRVLYTRVGPPEIAEEILRSGASFGYEETGKYIFPPDTLWGDAILSIVNLLRIMNEQGTSLLELAEKYPRFYQVKEKLPVDREIKRKVVERIGEFLENHMPADARDIMRIDGVKIVYDDAWLLIRASGTEDVIRIFSDAREEKRARELVEYGKKIVREFISSFSPLRG